ncbi:MAG TPA: glycerophosphodiester phosphodiesterase [Anaerolineae bacterium]|nr:glycerophosphodiester phosphodiesterase [Anaerolineae bacterium]
MGRIEPMFRSGKTLNFAHRGAREVAPENTLAAFRAARELGADGVELDVMLSADGEVVVIHDDTLDRTTDGSGRVRDRTLAELKGLDAGSWFDPTFAGLRIPTLQEVFDLIGGQMVLNIELKSRSLTDEGLEARVVELVERNGLVGSVILSSFNPWAIRRVKRLNPRLATGLLYAEDLPLPLRRAWLRPLVRPDALHPHHTMVTLAYVRWAKSRGHSIIPWTVNDPHEMRRLIELGVDGIITDRPKRLKDVLAASQP